MQIALNRRHRPLQAAAAVAALIGFAASATADIYQWEYINPADPSQGKRQSTTLAPDGAGVDIRWGPDLSGRNLTRAYLIGADLSPFTFPLFNIFRPLNFSGTNLADADLTSANLYHARLEDANLRGATLTKANFDTVTLAGADFTAASIRGASFARGAFYGCCISVGGITLEQLYSTASYQSGDLRGVNFTGNMLAGGALSGQDLAGAQFIGANLTDADFADADVRGANFDAYYYNGNFPVDGSGITPDQLYSTASYRARDLTGVNLARNDFNGANFVGQNLADANFSHGALTGANLSHARLTNASFAAAALTGADFTGADVRRTTFSRTYGYPDYYGTGITLDQLYSTGSYQARDLSGISLLAIDLAGANFAGQNLTNADLTGSTLTGADFNGAEVRGASFGYPGITLAQLNSTASYHARDLTGIALSGDLSGANFAAQDLTNVDFKATWGEGIDFTGAIVRGAALHGITLAQLYSTASYKAHDLNGIRLFIGELAGVNLSRQDLTDAEFKFVNLDGANFRHAGLTNAYINVSMTDVNFTGADTRGAQLAVDWSSYSVANHIRPDGLVKGVDLGNGEMLVVRDYDGSPYTYDKYEERAPIPRSPIAIKIDEHLTMAPGGALRIVFDADAWDSTISFAPGIPVTLGGTLELTFATDVNLTSQLGRTFDLFDWTGVTTTGAFAVSSPYAWDLSQLYTTGEVTLAAIPEPSAALLLLFAATIWCKQRRPNSQTRRTALFTVCLGCVIAGPSPAFGEFNLIEATIPQMLDAMASGETTSEALVTKYLQRIANLDDAGPMLNAVLALNPHALETARALDAERLATGPRGPLHGIPILVKDNIDTFDQPTTAGALIFEGSIPPDDAFLVQKLRAAGAVILGKSNLTEFGNFVSRTMPHGFSTLGGQTVNPYGPGVLSPYGSSSGSAVSVAANLAAAAVGDETSGSIVAPAWANSVVGIRSTVGLVSRNGMIPVSHTQDTAGPLTRTVTDAAVMLGAMAGVDPNDPATLASVGKSWDDYTQFLKPDGLVGKRIGIVRFPQVLVMDPVDVPLANAAFDALEEAGAEVVDNLDLSSNLTALLKLWGPAYPKTLTHEFAHNIESYLESLGDQAPATALGEIIAFNQAHAAQAIPFGQDILQEALATGGDLNDPAYIAERNEGIRLMGTDGIDALLDSNNLDALVLPYDWSVIGSVPGYPAIQVPAGFSANGMPFSLGFVGKPFTEPELIEIAYAFEQATLLRRPPEIATQPADFNHDGAVDAEDLSRWQGDFGMNADSDADLDGDSDGADFLIWQRQLGQTVPNNPASPIPEPGGVGMALGVACAVDFARRRRQS